MIDKYYIFKRTLLLIFFIFFASLLIYTDYLQEIYLFSNKFKLNSFNVDMKTYYFFKKYLILDQNSLFITELPNVIGGSNGNINNGDGGDKINSDLITKGNLRYAFNDIKDDNFYLYPPFPKLDLVYVGPTFIENGTISLTCEYNFNKIKCNIQGVIQSDRIYLSNTYLSNSKYEFIQVDYSMDNLHNFFKSKKGKAFRNKSGVAYDETINENDINNHRLLSNYLFLFGFNGTHIPMFYKENVEFDPEFVTDKKNLYQCIQRHIEIIFQLIQLKLINFSFLLISFLIMLVLHLFLFITLLLIYGPSDFHKHGPRILNEDELTTSLPNFEVGTTAATTTTTPRINFESSNVSISTALTSQQQAAANLYRHYSPSTISIEETNLRPLALETLFNDTEGIIPLTANSNYNEQYNNGNNDNSYGEYNFDYHGNDLMGKCKIVYGLIILHFFVHYLLYYAVNFIIQQGIDKILKTISGNEIEINNYSGGSGGGKSSQLEYSQGNSDSSASSTAENWNTSGGETFTALLNITGLVLNTLLFSFFHYLYGAMIFIYTVSLF